MKKTGWTILLVTALSYIPVVGAQEQTSEEPFKTADWRKDFSISIGTKLWYNEWTTFPGTVESKDELTPIPVVSVKYQDLFISASHFFDTHYIFPDPFNPDVPIFGRGIERKEWDVGVGYYILPPYLALTVGYKKIEQDFVVPENGGLIEYEGPTVGFAGAVPMKWGFSLYSSFAYGFMEQETEFPLFPPEFQQEDVKTDYWLVETGVAYTYDLHNLPVNSLSSAMIYAGYRHQQLESENLITNTDTNRDITRGMVIGVNLSF
jgi:hypothetical protein